MICLGVNTKNEDVVTCGNTIRPVNLFHIFHRLKRTQQIGLLPTYGFLPLVEHCSTYAETMGLNLFEGPRFFFFWGGGGGA